MKIQYIGHSGFSVELEHSVLLFDYYEGEIPTFPQEKHLYVFSSHFHHDHFNMAIFKLAELYDSVTYILSHDIGKKFNEKFFLRHGISKEMYDQFVFMPERVTKQMQDIEVQTFHSTDEGVAFLVTAEGKHIYHAGDLQWWSWPGEDELDNQKMMTDFQSEINSFPKIVIDVAFLVLDPRQEDDFYLGFDYFMRHTDTKLAYPMHFWKDASVIDRLLEMDISKEYREKVVSSNFYI